MMTASSSTSAQNPRVTFTQVDGQTPTSTAETEGSAVALSLVLPRRGQVGHAEIPTGGGPISRRVK